VSGNQARAESLVACERITRQHARSFYFAARFLPRATRHDVFALYAFYRTVDDLVDCRPDGASSDAVIHELNRWRARIDASPEHAAPHPILPALRAAINKHAIPRRYFHELLDGVASDLSPRHMRTFEELRHYCYQVAGTVGLVMAYVLGAGSDTALRHACDLGIAMQLTNVLRDVGEDIARGVVYLPADDMSRFGYSADRLAERRVDDDFVALMHMQIARARAFYRSGLEGIPLLPRDCQFPILLAARVYGDIMRKIERGGYDVFRQRAHTRLPEKLWLAGTCYRDLHQPVWTNRLGFGKP
jgi:phytoene synthase